MRTWTLVNGGTLRNTADFTSALSNVSNAKIFDLISPENRLWLRRTLLESCKIMLKAKSKLVVWSIEIKKEAKNVMIRFKKRHIKGKKTVLGQLWKTNGFCTISQNIRRFREQQSLLWPIPTKWIWLKVLLY